MTTMTERAQRRVNDLLIAHPCAIAAASRTDRPGKG